MKKALIFDSGVLINLSMNGLLPILEKLKKNFDGKFLITEQVKREIIDKPLTIQRFELGAMRMQSLLDSNVIELPPCMEIDCKKVDSETENLMKIANNCIRLKNKSISIVSPAEMSCLALASELEKKGVESLIAIDERTTRVLSESAETLETMMSDRLHQQIKLDIKALKIFKGHNFIRSPELVYVAYKKGLTDIKGKKALEALVYATKFKGSSISFDELNELKKL
jgi:hypothetical protein